MKLHAMISVTLDGVYQGPGAPDEDRRGGFDRGGWESAHGEGGWTFITSVHERADAMLLGRTTFEIWEAYWPDHDWGDPVSHGINVMPKYVPSTTRTDSRWQNTRFLSGDVESAIRELKAQPGRDILLQGSGVLFRWLLERDLVDEVTLIVHPVVVGDGLRLFPERGPSHDMALVEARSLPSGVSVVTYRPNGRASFGEAG